MVRFFLCAHVILGLDISNNFILLFCSRRTTASSVPFHSLFVCLNARAHVCMCVCVCVCVCLYFRAAGDVVYTPTRADFYDYLSSDDFKKKYWEKRPVLIRTERAFSDIITLEKVLNGWYNGKPHHKPNPGHLPIPSFNALPGNFHEKNTDMKKHGWSKEKTLMGRDHMETLMGEELNTLQFFKVEEWEPKVADLLLEHQTVTQRVARVNMYITPPNQSGTVPHNDFTCNFMIHVHGRKRWKLWTHQADLNPVSQTQIKGRDWNEN